MMLDESVERIKGVKEHAGTLCLISCRSNQPDDTE
jgi:hypothetical protein